MKKLFFPLIAIIMAVAAYAGQDVLKMGQTEIAVHMLN